MGKGMNKTIPIHITSAVACPSTDVHAVLVFNG